MEAALLAIRGIDVFCFTTPHGTFIFSGVLVSEVPTLSPKMSRNLKCGSGLILLKIVGLHFGRRHPCLSRARHQLFAGTATFQFDDVCSPVLLPRATEAVTGDVGRTRQKSNSQEWTQWTAPQNNFPVYVDMTITPIVETMIYTSGARSDRVVFGFSPDHLNPFNQGRVGALDNEYVATQAQEQSCVKPDFFNGQLNPAGWGPFMGNFGSDLDQGISFAILGYGFSFKKMTFDIQSQIRFLIDNNVTSQHQELVFKPRRTAPMFLSQEVTVDLNWVLKFKDVTHFWTLSKPFFLKSSTASSLRV